MTFNTPNVYLREQQVLPSSVSTGITALPVFIGYTEKIPVDSDGNELSHTLTLVSTLLDYESLFGAANQSKFSVTVDIDDNVTELVDDTETEYLLHPAINLYFRNGSGPCYIWSLGTYDGSPLKEDFDTALALLADEEAPTLLVLTDAVALNSTEYHNICKDALAQSAELKDRFTILDVQSTTTGNQVDDFRAGIGTDNLSYGAAYYPDLLTTLTFNYVESDVTVKHAYGLFEIDNSIRVTYAGTSSANITIDTDDLAVSLPYITVTDDDIRIAVGVSGSSPASILEAWEDVLEQGDFNVEVHGSGSIAVLPQVANFIFGGELGTLSEDSIKVDSTTIYNNVVAAINLNKVVLPPSAAVAAAYSTIDASKGPWHAPANIVLGDVIGPVIAINNEDQEDLNVDSDGKSINAIRSFFNRGTIIWGARTLDGNSSEWRYVPVRRLFIKIESEMRRATAFSVFEPNTSYTWLKIKTMLIGYLEDLFSAGALSGSSSEEAYFVSVGLGETMDEQDILEGRLNISVGIAAVRPAEFIVVTVSHILQTG